MNGILSCLINKEAISDDMLILCWNYCQLKNMSDKMLKIIELVVLDSLNFSNPSKTRDYLYFKKYLLNSTIWHQTVKMKKHDSNSNGDQVTVFDVILGAMQPYLDANKQYVFEQLSMTKDWEPLHKARLGISGNEENEKKNDDRDANDESKIAIELRQDSLACNKPEYTSDELTGRGGGTFDSLKEYESKIYLTKLLIKANNLNNLFQSQMKSFVAVVSPEHAKFSPAPIKTIERCLIKAQTDYHNAKYPRTASIVDLVRCSITFDNATEMLRFFRKFRQRIDDKQTRCIKKILRIKNGFESILKDSGNDDKELKAVGCDYRDIKMNVLISNDDGSEQIVGEVQLLTRIMLSMKQRGHSLYSVIRRAQFVDNIKQMKSRKENLTLEDIVKQRDIEEFGNYLLHNNSNSDTKEEERTYDIYSPSMLLQLNEMGWYKASKLLLSNIYHKNKLISGNGVIEEYLHDSRLINLKFGDIKTETKEDNDNDHVTGEENHIFGIKLKDLPVNNDYDSRSDIIEQFYAKSPFFDEIRDDLIVYHCVVNNLFQFLKLLLLHRSNDSGIINGINICDNERTDGMTPLMKLMTLKHLNKEWLELLLSYKECDFVKIKCSINKDDSKYGEWNDKTFAKIAINCLEYKWKAIAEEIIAKSKGSHYFNFD